MVADGAVARLRDAPAQEPLEPREVPRVLLQPLLHLLPLAQHRLVAHGPQAHALVAQPLAERHDPQAAGPQVVLLEDAVELLHHLGVEQLPLADPLREDAPPHLATVLRDGGVQQVAPDGLGRLAARHQPLHVGQHDRDDAARVGLLGVGVPRECRLVRRGLALGARHLRRRVGRLRLLRHLQVAGPLGECGVGGLDRAGHGFVSLSRGVFPRLLGCKRPSYEGESSQNGTT